MLPENIKFSFFETKFIYRIEEVVKLNSFYLNYSGTSAKIETFFQSASKFSKFCSSKISLYLILF